LHVVELPADLGAASAVHKFVELKGRGPQGRGLRLHCVEVGSGPLVVLLHGFPEFWYSWRHQLPALAAAGFRAVAVDMRGYNTSDKPPLVSDYALPELSADVDALIAALGESKAFVVAHDWGGVVAWDFAMNYPERLRGLAVMNLPHPQQMAKGLRTLKQLKRSWYVFAFQIPVLPERSIAANDYAVLRRSIAGGVRRERRQPEDVEPYVEAMKNPGALTAALNYYRAAVRGARDRRPWRKIEVPVLVVWGDQDHYLGVELSRPDPKWVPDVRVEIIHGATHFVQVDAPDEVNARLLAYLTERRGAGA
jgi:pimeloyl-ACP methyl ester carboxylesterase